MSICLDVELVTFESIDEACMNRNLRWLMISLLLTFLPPAISLAQGRTGSVSTSGARIYDRPSVLGERKAEVPISTAVKVLDEEGEWSGPLGLGPSPGFIPSEGLE